MAHRYRPPYNRKRWNCDLVRKPPTPWSTLGSTSALVCFPSPYWSCPKEANSKCVWYAYGVYKLTLFYPVTGGEERGMETLVAGQLKCLYCERVKDDEQAERSRVNGGAFNEEQDSWLRCITDNNTNNNNEQWQQQNQQQEQRQQRQTKTKKKKNKDIENPKEIQHLIKGIHQSDIHLHVYLFYILSSFYKRIYQSPRALYA